MRRLALGLLGVAVLALPAVGAEAQSASRLVDRTFACMTRSTGDLDLTAHPHTVYPSVLGRADEVVSAFLEVSSGVDTFESALVAVRARPLQGIGGGRVQPAGVHAHAARCGPARTLVPLSRKGLAGPPVQWYKALDCPIAGRVLVHVRATLRGPGEWERAGAYQGAHEPVTEAKVAVRAANTRKPIAYMELTGGKKTKMWYSGACR